MDETSSMEFDNRIDELEKLFKMLEADCEVLKTNLQKASRLNEIICANFKEK